MKRIALQWLILTVVFMIGVVGYIFMAGEDDPFNPLPFGKWFLLKMVGLALFIIAFLMGRYFNRKGLLPDIKEE